MVNSDVVSLHLYKLRYATLYLHIPHFEIEITRSLGVVIIGCTYPVVTQLKGVGCVWVCHSRPVQGCQVSGYEDPSFMLLCVCSGPAHL